MKSSIVIAGGTHVRQWSCFVRTRADNYSNGNRRTVLYYDLTAVALKTVNPRL